MAFNVANYERQTQILEGLQSVLNTLSNAGKVQRSRTFITNGSWICPPGVTEVQLTGGGGGGGGGSANANGTIGTTTSFGNLVILPGGGPGVSDGVNGGISGGPGGSQGGSGGIGGGGDGGSGGYYKGGNGTKNGTGSANGASGAFCSGGGGSANASGGGAGDFIIDRAITVTPGSSYAITIGAGGNGGNPSGGNGGNGILTIKWYE